jgi:Rha family phage regulatory protein
MSSIQGIKLTIINEKPVTTSREIALHFEKQHKVVLHKIESLDCSPQFNEHNFMPVTYQDSKGESRKAYQITRNGFMYLAMGFTGKRAGQFKEAYIRAFDEIELELQKLRQAPLQQEKPTLNDFINSAEPLQKTRVEVIHTKQGEIVQIGKLEQKSEPELSHQESTVSHKQAWIPIVETLFSEI